VPSATFPAASTREPVPDATAPPNAAKPKPATPKAAATKPAATKATAPKAGRASASAWKAPNADGSCPKTHPVKAKMASGIFHVPGGANYARTKPDRCYVDAAAATADGLRPAKA
jgi:hypothetical protein